MWNESAQQKRLRSVPTPDWLNLQVQPLPISAADYDHLAAALEEPPRDLPRLRELLREPGRFGNA
jgi:hypothetical protein